MLTQMHTNSLPGEVMPSSIRAGARKVVRQGLIGFTGAVISVIQWHQSGADPKLQNAFFPGRIRSQDVQVFRECKQIFLSYFFSIVNTY